MLNQTNHLQNRIDTGFVLIGLDEPYRVFISEDPIDFAGGINFYAYVWNSPMNWNDPLGEGWLWIPWWAWKLKDCPKLAYKCRGCYVSIECADRHRDAEKCFDRGETDLRSSHRIRECLVKKPECLQCLEALKECGLSLQ